MSAVLPRRLARSPAARGTAPVDYSQVHPRTLLWWQQREQCRACAHHRGLPVSHKRGGNATGGGERCAAAPARPSIAGRRDLRAPESALPYCIDMREPFAACGPAAVLFEEA